MLSSRRWTGRRTRAGDRSPVHVRARRGRPRRIAKGETMKSDSPHRDSVDTAPTPSVVDRAAFEAEIEGLRAREKAHIRQGDEIAAARRRLPMVEVDANLELTGPDGQVSLLDAFEGRRQLVAYYFMWNAGKPAPEQCEGCTWVTTQVQELVLSALPRHHLRGLLSGALRRRRQVPRLHGLAYAVVLGAPLARRAAGRSHRGHDAHRQLSTRRRSRLRDVLDDAVEASRRWITASP